MPTAKRAHRSTSPRSKKKQKEIEQDEIDEEIITKEPSEDDKDFVEPTKEVKKVETKKIESSSESSNANANANATATSTDETLERFKYMYLKTIIKENHGKEINQIALNFAEEKYSNMVATVGDIQANVYDNENMGKHLDLVLHFQNVETPFTKTKSKTSTVVRTCCWMKESGSESELKGDAYLAIGGEDQLIHIISIKYTKVITLLRGCTGTVIDLVAHPHYPQLLVSVSSDNTLRLWDIHAKKPNSNCVHVWNSSQTIQVATFSPEGNHIIVGGANGTITQVDIEELIKTHVNNPNKSKNSSTSALPTTQLKMEKKYHTGPIDCLRFLGDRLVSKSVDGRVAIWDISTGQIYSEIRVTNSRSITSRFDISRDGAFLCVGNSEGQVYVFKTSNGQLIRKLEHKRSRTPVKACVFSKDANNILYVTSDANLWRFDYIDPAVVAAHKSTEQEQ